MSTASRCFSFVLNACCRKSLDVSTIKVCPACSIRTETRSRLSRGSSDVQVSQSQAIEGTPVEVPVPKKVSFIKVKNDWSASVPLAKTEISRGLQARTLALQSFSPGDIAGAEF